MAGTLYVAEFSQLGLAAEQQAALAPPLADYKIAVGLTSTTGPTFNVATRFVRLHCDATNPVSVLIGPAATVTATASNARLAVNQTEYYAVPQNQGAMAVAAFPNT